MKWLPWWCLAAIAVAFVVYSKHNNSIQKAQEQERRDMESKREERERKEFENDIAFAVKALDARDIEIYKLAIARDGELLLAVSNVFASADIHKSEYRKNLEDEFVWWLNHHIEDCKRIVSRIGEGRGVRHPDVFGLLPYSLFEIYETKCDCSCCGRE